MRRFVHWIGTYYNTISYVILALGVMAALAGTNHIHNDQQAVIKRIIEENQQRVQSDQDLLESRTKALCIVQVNNYRTLRDLIEGVESIANTPELQRFLEDELRRLDSHKPVCESTPAPAIIPPTTTATFP